MHYTRMQFKSCYGKGERKMKDMRWQEAETIQERKVFTKERRLM